MARATMSRHADGGFGGWGILAVGILAFSAGCQTRSRSVTFTLKDDGGHSCVQTCPDRVEIYEWECTLACDLTRPICPSGEDAGWRLTWDHPAMLCPTCGGKELSSCLGPILCPPCPKAVGTGSPDPRNGEYICLGSGDAGGVCDYEN